MKILLLPVGSHGDVHPFVGLGSRLQQRGHDVTLATSEPFGELAQRMGLKFEALGTTEEFQRLLDHPDLWHPRKAPAFVAREGILPGMHRQYEFIKSHYQPQQTLIVGSCLGFGCPLAHESFGVPFASLHLQPVVFLSEHQSPTLARFTLTQDWVPRWLKRFQFRMGVWMAHDRVLLKETNAFRTKLGLPPVRSVYPMWHSPQLNLGMFPEWFAPPQPDWPQPTILPGFPLWDEKGVTEVPPDVEDFLSAGDPPIAFTPGSAMVQGEKFFAAAVDACQRTGRRGMLLTRHARHVPAELPEGVKHVEYAPFSEILPRCAALVYHGGVGTLSQALAAGIPHVVMPMAFDQPDNAMRIKRLGVGDFIWPASFRGGKLAAVLERLFSSEDVRNRCAKLAARISGQDALGKACDAIEKLVPERAPGTV